MSDNTLSLSLRSPEGSLGGLTQYIFSFFYTRPPEFCMASHSDTTDTSTHLTTPDIRLPPAARLGNQRLEIPPTAPQQRRSMPPSSERGESFDSTPPYLVISGGTGCNAICAAFAHACYVLPVSDDGGSSSEIIRVLGGPSVGR
jgi:hypothetical protein